MNKVVVWKPVEYLGMEYLNLEADENRILARGVVLGVENRSAFQVNYSVVCDQNYGVRAALVIVNERGHNLLSSDGKGNWSEKVAPVLGSDEQGKRTMVTAASQKSLPEYTGCIDIDISATPFTNTLPIRRLQWQVGQAEVFKMVYILVPDLKVSVMRQRYTCLEKTDHGATFRYESLDSDFTAVLNVDSDGLVLNYPGLFERVI